MILTRDYRPIWASFDRPRPFKITMERESGHYTDLMYQFEVGPLTYEVELIGHQEHWDLAFDVVDITGTDEELRDHFSKVFRKELTVNDVTKIKSDIMNNRMGDLVVGGAPEVFATVMAIVKDLRKYYPVQCVSFSATTDKKKGVYEKMIRRFTRGWIVERDPSGGFMICEP